MNSHRRMDVPVVAIARGQSHNAGMKAWLALSLAVLWPVVGVDAMEPTVTLHRCTDPRGKLTWQSDACPKGSLDEVREMIRPVDEPKSAHKPVAQPPVVEDELPPPPPRRRELLPPPPMYKCTSYDGNERFSESYDPNPRCEPIVVYYPYPNLLTPAQALSCRWVEDSCVRLSDQRACERWKSQRKEAISLVQRAFSDSLEYRRSELKRLSQIVEESCP
ncbi:MAG: hypothetical protein ABI588_09225 [Arenimonas sp.]